MSEDNEATAQDAPPAQQFSIAKLYLKDVSFESPHSPGLFAGNNTITPHINLQLNTETREVGENAFEVILNVSVTATSDDKTIYLVEVKQAGIFIVRGFEKAVHDNILGSHCPSSLFPYAREAVSSLVSKGGFPQLSLEPISFEALYAQHLEKLKQTAPAPSTPQ